MAKHPGGRPLKYKPSFPQDLVEYFKTPAPSSGKSTAWTYFPTLEGWCNLVGISPVTVSDWATKYPEFSKALEICNAYQKDCLLQAGLTGKYNANFAKFILVNNCGMLSESAKIETNNNHNFPSGIEITFITPNHGVGQDAAQ